MHAGTISWNGLDLSGLGKPKLGITTQADPPAPAFPTRQLVTLKVTVDIEAADPGTVQARVEHLRASMKVHEGILRSSTGTGHALEWLAIPGGDNLASVLSGGANTLEMSFSAVENHASGAITGITSATFTPAGSESPITLHAMREVVEKVDTERHSPRASARKLSTHTYTFTARVAQANAADPLATRLAYLQAQATAVKSLDCREGLLAYGSTSQIVRVTELSPLIDEGRGVVDLRVQCFYSVLPDDAVAEVGLDIKTRIDAGSGESVLTFSGTIDAETRTIALAKLEAIRAAQSTFGRRTTHFETGDKSLSGADIQAGPDTDWTGSLNFTLEMREARAGSHYSLKISTSRDIRAGMRWSYSGSVTAASEGAALTAARALATAAGHPVQTKSDENIEHVTDIYLPATGAQAPRNFVKLDFTYEFEGPSDGFIGGEITTDRNLPLFGEYRRMISGFLVATTRAAAEARLDVLLAGELAAIEKTLKWSETYLDESGTDVTPKQVFQKLDFTAGSRELRTNASAKYTDSTSSDIATMMQQREVSGSVWSDTAAHADTALDALILALFGATATDQPTRRTRTHQKEAWGSGGSATTTLGNAAWVQLDFQLGKSTKIAGAVGYDIIEASSTTERVSAIQNTVITPIPFGRPAVQKDTGWLPGTVSLNATCKAVLASTARDWVQGKMAVIGGTAPSFTGGIGVHGTTRHLTAQPRESCAPEYQPFSGSVTTVWSFTGNYQWTFTDAAAVAAGSGLLDGMWPTTAFAGIGGAGT